jgi:hypothetical protein
MESAACRRSGKKKKTDFWLGFEITAVTPLPAE